MKCLVYINHKQCPLGLTAMNCAHIASDQRSGPESEYINQSHTSSEFYKESPPTERAQWYIYESVCH